MLALFADIANMVYISVYIGEANEVFEQTSIYVCKACATVRYLIILDLVSHAMFLESVLNKVIFFMGEILQCSNF